MAFSPLVSKTLPAHGKFNSRQGLKIGGAIVHHWAGTKGGDSRLTNPSEAASANYIIYSDGTIAGQVPEEFRAWTSGSFNADGSRVTIEVQNSTNGPEWKVSNEAYSSLIRLITDLAHRHKWGGVTVTNVRGHREFQATACPGPFLWPRLGDVREKANAFFKSGSLPPKTNTASKPTKTPVANKSVNQLADEVLRGLHGSGDTRKKNLGNMYDKVQAEINRRILGDPTPSKPKSKVKSVEELAKEVIDGKHGTGKDRVKSLGARYNEVQAEVNRILKFSAPAPKNTKVDVTRLAKAVIRGDYGTGEKRKRLLGSNYSAVQKEVNRLLSK